MAHSYYWDPHAVTGRRQLSIVEEIHLVKPGEFRRLDYPIQSHSNFTSNVALNLDYSRNGFLVMEADNADNHGFVRVVISYMSEV